jgi:hypothetical protein
MPERMTDHHMLFYREEWSVRPEGLWLREHGGLRVDLSRPDHDEMHRRVALVPVLGVHALQRVASDYKPVNSLYQNLDRFVALTERALKHPRSHKIEQDLGHLTIEAMLMQRDFIEEVRGRKGVQVSEKQKLANA